MYWSGVYIGVKKREAEYICTLQKNDQDLLSEVSKLKSSKHSFQIRDVKKVLGVTHPRARLSGKAHVSSNRPARNRAFSFLTHL